MPEGDTIHRTAAALRTAVLGKASRLRGAAPRRHAPVARRGDRARREQGQAPRDRLRRRCRAAHPHADDRSANNARTRSCRRGRERADAPTPVDLVNARDRRRPPPVLFDDTGDISGPIDPADVVPALERHPASQALLAGFQPRGPEPIFVDPLLGREPEAAKAPDDEGDDDATGAVS